MNNEEKEKLVIKTIEKIRPYLQADGGDVSFVRMEDDIVYVKVEGACIGCASINQTLKDGVEALIMDEVEGIKEVRLDEDQADYVNDDFLKFLEELEKREKEKKGKNQK